MKNLKLLLFSLAASSTFFLSSCSKDDDPVINENLTPGGMNFGLISSAVVVVNPVINQGSSTTVPTGATRSGVSVKVGAMPAVTSDATGLAVINDIPTGAQSLSFNNGNLPFDVVNKGELYDMIVSYTNNVAYVVPVVRYPIGGTVTTLNPGDNISAAAGIDNAIIFLKPGTYAGNVTVSGSNVLIFGSWDALEGPKSIIDGNLVFNGGGGRIRGMQVNNTITVNANGFSAAFSNFYNADIKGNSIVLLRNRFTGPSVIVPSSSAVLVDNAGIQ